MSALIPSLGCLIHRQWSSAERLPYQAVVVVPARNEAQLIGRCLRAIAAQTAAAQLPVAALVLVNGSTDATYDEALRTAQELRSIDIHLVEASLPAGQCEGGAARQWAMRLACTLPALPEAALFLTDADSAVPAHWLQNYGALIWQRDYDAVAGEVAVADEDLAALPSSLRERMRAEAAYALRLDALEARLDPCAHDPWPRHYQASGANIAIRRELCCSLLHAPWPICGEDKALIAAVEARDGRVRHDTSLRVTTSGRLFGRARGGMADTMRQRIMDPGLPCDSRLEAVDSAYFRARARHLWRELHTQPPTTPALLCLAETLGLNGADMRYAHGMASFGVSWQWLEARSPHLRRRALTQGELPWHTTRADLLLEQLDEQARSRLG